MFSLQQNQRMRGQKISAWKVSGGGKVAQTMYIHVSKYKNEKNKKIYFQKKKKASNAYIHSRS
jgi:3-methyladenine DNA glycosylase Mpg